MSDPAPFLYFELLPPAALRSYVQTYWGFDVRRASAVSAHTVWPDGCLSLLCRIRPGAPVVAVLSGPRAEPLQVPVQVGESYRGVRLWPWASGPLLGCTRRPCAIAAVRPRPCRAAASPRWRRSPQPRR